MEGPKAFYPISSPTRRATAATLVQSGPTEMLPEKGKDRAEAERLVGIDFIFRVTMIKLLLLPITAGVLRYPFQKPRRGLESPELHRSGNRRWRHIHHHFRRFSYRR